MFQHKKQQIAMEARCALELDGRAPEGIELYRWLWVSSDREEIIIPVNQPNRAFVDDPSVPSATTEHPTVTITPVVELVREPDLLARCGWDIENRIAVLFLFEGGKKIERWTYEASYFSDADMHALAESGRIILGYSAPLHSNRLDGMV